ncbi:MAG TPA: efflux RND transporter periplasmic adaptor subunit [Solimonas sp.]|nr:efflux RND transporter periplasmic adaptor subunit [Solimonas sp.]
MLFAVGYGLARHVDVSTHLTQVEPAGKPTVTDHVSGWTCPMHPQIRQDHAGDCPICGMHLVPVSASGAGHGDHVASPDHAEPLASPTGAAWVCPMHPQIHSNHPGKCPICGMDLVQGADDAQGTDHRHGAVIDGAMRQTLGIRLASVEPRELSRQIRTWGVVTLDESSRRQISPKVDGWIRELRISAVGEAVRAGQVLYTLYSPELVQRQREYVDLIRRREQLLNSLSPIEGQNAQVLASLARERMRQRRQFENADVDKAFIDALEQTRRPADVVAVRAKKPGIVVDIGARAGSYVTPQVDVLSIAASSSVWVDVALYPNQWGWVAAGDAVSARRQNGQGDEIRGALQLPDALVDRERRILHGRLVVRDARALLRPGEYLDVRIATRPHRALAIPRSALIRTGAGDRVMLADGDGRFVPTAVQTGIESDDFVEIVSGLKPADQVAIKGQFLLDAAASLLAVVQPRQAGS